MKSVVVALELPPVPLHGGSGAVLPARHDPQVLRSLHEQDFVDDALEADHRRKRQRAPTVEADVFLQLEEGAAHHRMDQQAAIHLVHPLPHLAVDLVLTRRQSEHVVGQLLVAVDDGDVQRALAHKRAELVFTRRRPVAEQHLHRLRVEHLAHHRQRRRVVADEQRVDRPRAAVVNLAEPAHLRRALLEHQVPAVVRVHLVLAAVRVLQPAVRMAVRMPVLLAALARCALPRHRQQDRLQDQHLLGRGVTKDLHLAVPRLDLVGERGELVQVARCDVGGLGAGRQPCDPALLTELMRHARHRRAIALTRFCRRGHIVVQ